VQPGREAARMSSYVTAVAGANPSCLAPVGPPPNLLRDGFEGGILPGPWSGKVP